MDQDLHAAPLRPLQRERCDAQRQRRHQERRRERRGDRLMRRAGGAQVRRRVEQLPARPHDRAAPRHLHANRIDAEQIIARELRLDLLKQRCAGAGHREQRSARGAGQRLESLRHRLSIADRIHRHARVGRVEHGTIELQRVHAGARRRREAAELDHQRGVGQQETFRDQNQRLRPVDAAEADEQLAQADDCLIALMRRVHREAPGLREHGIGTQRIRAPGQRLTLARDDLLHHDAIAAIDRERLGERDVEPEIAELARLLLTGHPADRLLHALAVGGEHRRRRAGSKPGDRHAVRRHQPIDERVGRPRNRQRAAEPDVRLVDGDDDQPSGRRSLVRAEALRRRHDRRRVALLDEGNPLGRHDPPQVAVDSDHELAGDERRDRLAAIVDDRHVDRGHVHRCLEPRRLILRVSSEATAQHAGHADKHDSCAARSADAAVDRGFVSHLVAVTRYPWRARTS